MPSSHPIIAPAPARKREPGRIRRALRPDGAIGILITISVVIAAIFLYGTRAAAPLVLLWAWWTQTPWRDLGLERPTSWARAIVGGVLAGILAKLFMKAIVMPLLGAPDVNPDYRHFVGNTAALPGLIAYMVVVAGFGEEIISRGFMFDRLGHLLGTSRNARIAAVLITSVIFGVAHYPEQQWIGAAHAFIVALMVGTYFVITRSLWPVIVMHAVFDICAVLIVYYDLEAAVANAVFH
jgi:membrane protease YdiL (CAAX protease family)